MLDPASQHCLLWCRHTVCSLTWEELTRVNHMWSSWLTWLTMDVIAVLSLMR